MQIVRRVLPVLFLAAIVPLQFCEAQEPVAQEVGGYRVTLRSCDRNRQQVTCEFEVVNLSDSDRILMVDTAQLRSIILNARREALGLTTLVDSEGSAIVATRARFANFDSDPSGQSDFKVLSKTKPTLRIVFEGVGLSLRTASRIELAIGERTDGPFEKFPLVFEDVVIQGTKAGGGPPPADDTPYIARVEAEDYSVRFRECIRETSTTTVVCSGDVINLLDHDRTIYFSTRRKGLHRNSLDELGISSLVDEEGNTYEASSVMFAGEGGNASSGQSWFPIEAWKRKSYVLRFEGVPSTLSTAARFDLILADRRANKHYPLNTQFTNVTVARHATKPQKKAGTE